MSTGADEIDDLTGSGDDGLVPVAGVPFTGGVMSDSHANPVPLTGDALTDLLDAILAVASELELPAVLNRFVQVSAELTGARYGAINVLDANGASTTFVYTGVPTSVARMMKHAPHARGVLGQIPAVGALRLDDLREHPAFQGWPAHHPPMGSFLGASVRVGEHVFGQLYLSEKVGGFTESDEQTVIALAAATGVAVANAQLYAESARREHWLRAGQEITTMLLEGIDEEEALAHIAATAREVAGADTAALALPGVGGRLFIELADGHNADDLVGVAMPEHGRAWTVMTEGHGLLTPSLSASRNVKVEQMRAFGPAMFAPLQTSGRGVGVLILLRRVGSLPFEESDLTTAESFASQAALAFVLAEARHAQDIAALLDERERIARDLHDMAIQQLFATGMQLETVRRRAARHLALPALSQRGRRLAGDGEREDREAVGGGGAGGDASDPPERLRVARTGDELVADHHEPQLTHCSSLRADVLAPPILPASGGRAAEPGGRVADRRRRCRPGRASPARACVGGPARREGREGPGQNGRLGRSWVASDQGAREAGGRRVPSPSRAMRTARWTTDHTA